MYSDALQLFLFVVHSVLITVTLLANGSVIWAFSRNWKYLIGKPRLKTNAFLLNLAIFDFLVAFFTWPLSVVYKLLGRQWFLGPLLCHIWIDSDYLLTCGSVLNVAMLSLDRYLGMKMTAKYTVPLEIRNRVIYCMIGATWVIPLVLYVPINELWDFERTGMLSHDGGLCAEPWQDHEKTVWIVNISIFFPTLFCLTVPYILLIIEVLRLRKRRSDSVGSNTATQTSAKRIQTRSTSYFSHKDQRKQKLDKTPVTHKNYDKQKRYHLDLNESLDAIDDSSVGREKAGRLKHAVSSLSEYDMRFRSVGDVMGGGPRSNHQLVVPEICVETAGMRLLKQPSREDWTKIMTSQNLKVVQGQFDLAKGGFEIEVECVNRLKPTRFRSDSTLAASPQIHAGKTRRSFAHNFSSGMRLNASRITQTISNLFTSRHFHSEVSAEVEDHKTKSSDTHNFNFLIDEASHSNSSTFIGDNRRNTFHSPNCIPLIEVNRSRMGLTTDLSSKSKSSEVSSSALNELSCKLNTLEKLAHMTAGTIKQLDTYLSGKFSSSQSKVNNTNQQQLKAASSSFGRNHIVEMEQQLGQPGSSDERVRRHGVHAIHAHYHHMHNDVNGDQVNIQSNFSPIEDQREEEEMTHRISERKLSRSACCLELMETNSESQDSKPDISAPGCSQFHAVDPKFSQITSTITGSPESSKEGCLDLFALNEVDSLSSKFVIDRKIVNHRSRNSNELASKLDFGTLKRKRYSLVDVIQQMNKQSTSARGSYDVNARRNVDKIREDYKRKLFPSGGRNRNSLSEGDHKLEMTSQNGRRHLRDSISHFKSSLSRRASTLSTHRIRIWVTTPENAKFVGHVIVLVATCLVCWLPYCIVSTAHWTTKLHIDPIVFDFVVWLVYLNSLLNPFVYLSQNRLVRKAVLYSIKQSFGKRPKCFRLYLWEELGCLKPLSDSETESYESCDSVSENFK